MTERQSNSGFASRPGDPTAIRSRWSTHRINPPIAVRMANLPLVTTDVTPTLRDRIKDWPFRRGVTVTEMLEALLARECPDDSGTAP